ncbi:MAG: hypothetical protein HOA15_08670 [Candidatus Marinimicrobia bacterium]|jgi:hypothetical protein|nr:hypothetical protein [Candidatus Neomarinimicrobiota bacterium]MBT3675927.1 hypothetical protein [Candidatus Neomarinimicrobiota bacterium]MBT3763258.1 hypothetical protein [Candidatus Neomarinimicrobiota bacterium]MBT4069232.1 hypothetical protein [Candidatus Neomarinimicrobiota bacterium]MBT4269769.1 hypothetical protein [Candidatus Neomarinimicrobiota bacterium]
MTPISFENRVAVITGAGGGNLNALGNDISIDLVPGNTDLHIRNIKVTSIVI